MRGATIYRHFSPPPMPPAFLLWGETASERDEVYLCPCKNSTAQILEWTVRGKAGMHKSQKEVREASTGYQPAWLSHICTAFIIEISVYSEVTTSTAAFFLWERRPSLIRYLVYWQWHEESSNEDRPEKQVIVIGDRVSSLSLSRSFILQ